MVPLLWVSLPSIDREREYWSIQLRGRFMNLLRLPTSDFRLPLSPSRGQTDRQTDRRSVTVHERSGRWKSNIWRGLLQRQCTNYRYLSHHLRAGSGSRTRFKIFFCPFFFSALRHGDGCIINQYPYSNNIDIMTMISTILIRPARQGLRSRPFAVHRRWNQCATAAAGQVMVREEFLEHFHRSSSFREARSCCLMLYYSASLFHLIYCIPNQRFIHSCRALSTHSPSPATVSKKTLHPTTPILSSTNGWRFNYATPTRHCSLHLPMKLTNCVINYLQSCTSEVSIHWSISAFLGHFHPWRTTTASHVLNLLHSLFLNQSIRSDPTCSTRTHDQWLSQKLRVHIVSLQWTRHGRTCVVTLARNAKGDLLANFSKVPRLIWRMSQLCFRSCWWEKNRIQYWQTTRRAEGSSRTVSELVRLLMRWERQSTLLACCARWTKLVISNLGTSGRRCSYHSFLEHIIAILECIVILSEVHAACIIAISM